ncbi:integrase core domain-containing protein [Streptomyces sp. MNP-20]|uniref:integrase core domain-containing protein n=1 Tax=Streptomyces sp. MNP-20 TaxID=2721165 RepID=UPI0035C7D4A1
MHQRLFSTVRQARLEIFQWLNYYNARWRHSALNYLSPAECEQHQLRAGRTQLPFGRQRPQWAVCPCRQGGAGPP